MDITHKARTHGPGGRRILRSLETAFKAVLFAGVLTVALLAAGLYYGLDREPLVFVHPGLSLEDVARIKELIRENNPGKLQGLGVREVLIFERDLNLLLSYGLAHSRLGRYMEGELELDSGSVIVRGTFFMPVNPFGAYLNITARIRPEPDDLLDWTFDNVKIGRVPFPGRVLGVAWPHALAQLEKLPEIKALMVGLDAIERVDIHSGRVSVFYDWKADQVARIKRQGKALLLPEPERRRLFYYEDLLRSFMEEQSQRRMSLAEALPPLFSSTASRTQAGSDPAAENRAVLLTLAAYAVNLDLERLLERPDETVEGPAPSTVEQQEGGAVAAGKRKPRRHGYVQLQLRGRRDLAQHFLVSAAITASAGSGMADFLGLYKELGDAMGGSGFSFADMAANRAGVEMAKLAAGSGKSALEVQAFLSGQVLEDDIMPRVDHLPEGIMELEFRRVYEDVDSEAYGLMEEEIKRRLKECRLYQ